MYSEPIFTLLALFWFWSPHLFDPIKPGIGISMRSVSYPVGGGGKENSLQVPVPMQPTFSHNTKLFRRVVQPIITKFDLDKKSFLTWIKLQTTQFPMILVFYCTKENSKGIGGEITRKVRLFSVFTFNKKINFLSSQGLQLGQQQTDRTLWIREITHQSYSWPTESNYWPLGILAINSLDLSSLFYFLFTVEDSIAHSRGCLGRFLAHYKK